MTFPEFMVKACPMNCERNERLGLNGAVSVSFRGGVFRCLCIESVVYGGWILNGR